MSQKLTFLVSADLHGKRRLYKAIAHHAKDKDIDLVILAGDLTRYRDDALEEEIKEILFSIRKPVLFVMGNDDEYEWMSELNLVNINQKKYIFNGVTFVGYQYSNPFVGGDFEKTEEEQEKDFVMLAAIIDNSTVLVTHNPCFGILDEPDKGKNVGGRGLYNLCSSLKPKYHLSGHIHESSGVLDNHFNVAWPKEKNIVKLEYYSGEYELIKIR